MTSAPPSRAADAILALLGRRGTDKTICPSEAARVLASGSSEWRSYMDEVHTAVDQLNASGDIRLSWKGEPLDQRRGAYRIARR